MSHSRSRSRSPIERNFSPTERSHPKSPTKDSDSQSRSLELDHLQQLIRQAVSDAIPQFALNTSSSTSSSAKKPKAGYLIKSSEIPWKSSNNRRHYEFNEKVIEDIGKAADLLSHDSPISSDNAVNLLAKLHKSALHQQKLIRVAERSEFGWATALEYEKDDLAEDSDDERRLRSAEARAGSKQRKRKQSLRFSFNANQHQTAPTGWQAPRRFFGATSNAASYFTRDNHHQPKRPTGPCFTCGSLNHWSFQCDNKRGNGTSHRFRK